MDILITLVKSTAILSLFYVLYQAILQKDTFYAANRHYLLAGIIAALILPFIEFTKTIYIDIPVISDTVMDTDNFVPILLETALEEKAFVINWAKVALVIYGVGVSFMIGRLLVQLYSLYSLLTKYPSNTVGKFTYVQIADTMTPFSFFRYICYNPALHTQEELQMIIAHEKVHASQLHTIDVLLTQVVLAFQWVNPLAWFYKKSLEQNLEFLADSGALQAVHSSKAYQYTLVKVSTTALRPALTNQFYHSLIKKRIVMLNKETSRRRNLFKLGAILPLLALFMYSFNVKEVIKYQEVAGVEETAFAKADSGTLNSKSNLIKVSNSQPIKENTSDKTLVTRTEIDPDSAKSNSIDKDSDNTNTGNTPVLVSKTQESQHPVFVINHTTADTQIEALEIYFKENHPDALIDIHDIKRDNKGEITSYQVKTKFKNTPEWHQILGINDKNSVSQGIQFQYLPGSVIQLKELGPKGFEMRSSSKGLYINDDALEMEPASLLGGLQLVTQNVDSDPFRVKITKDYTKEQLDALVVQLKKEYDVTFSYSNINFNNAGEITSISIKAVDNVTGNTANNRIASDTPIGTIIISRTSKGAFGVQVGGNSAKAAMGIDEWEKVREKRMQERRKELDEQREEATVERDKRREELEALKEEMKSQRKGRGEEMREQMDEKRKEMKEELKARRKEMKKKLKDSEKDGYTTHFNFRSDNNDKEPLYYLNGEKVSKDQIKDLTPDEIESVNVLKGKAALDGYGKEGKNGVVVIQLKN